MNQLLAELFALLAALSAATGGVADVKKMPDRPAIAQPVPASSSKNVVSVTNSNSKSTTPSTDDKKIVSPNKSEDVELKGAITGIKGNTLTVNGQSVTIDANTKIQGALELGKQVQIEAINKNGTLVAKEIQVGKATDVKKDDKSGKNGSDDSKLDDGKSGTSGSDDSKTDDKSGKSGSDDSKSGDKSGGSSGDDGSGHH